MKVDVLVFDDVEISRYRWWSKWIDIAVFDYGSYGYLLQMKVSRNNSKKFKCIGYKAISNMAHASIHEAGDLSQMDGKE